MSLLKKFALSGFLALSVLGQDRPLNPSLDTSKPIYYAANQGHVAHYKAFDATSNKWVAFKDYQTDNHLDVVIYRDVNGEVVESRQSTKNYEKMFAEVLKKKNEGKVVTEPTINMFLLKHNYLMNRDWDKK